MIVVIFEVQFREGEREDYFKLAAKLRSDLEKIDGFISGERFESTSTPGKYISISYWRDLESVKEWRNQAEHRDAQDQGRKRIISEYKLRVASVLREYTLLDREQTPEDSTLYFGI